MNELSFSITILKIVIYKYIFKNLKMCKNVRSYHSNQVAWQRSANKGASFIRISDILTFLNSPLIMYT